MKLLLSLLRGAGLGLLMAGILLAGQGFLMLLRVTRWTAAADCAGLSEQECDLNQELLLVDSGRKRWLGVALIVAGIAFLWAGRLLDNKKA